MNRTLHSELVARYGTPLYVYRLDVVRRAARALRAALPDGVRIYYSLKANPHPLVVMAVAGLGLEPEVSSVGELGAVTTAGVTPEHCLYTGPAKTVSELAEASRAGVRLYSIESTVDRGRLTVATSGATVEYLVRLNALGGVSGGGLRMTGSPSQFGVPVETLTHGTPLLASEGGTRPVGFHVFSATNLAGEAAVLAELRSNVVTAATAVNRTDLVPELVDIGGGFGAPFATPGARPRYPGLRAGLAASLDEHLPGWRSGEPVVAVESGRHVVGGAGELLTTVLDVKVSGGRRFVLCDAGINALGGMSGLGRLLPGNAQPAGQPADAAPVALVGPLCTPLDILSGSARVGNPAVGDVLAIPNVGAYGLTASLVSFLGRPLPAEVVVDGEAVVDARRLALIPLDLAYPAAHA